MIAVDHNDLWTFLLCTVRYSLGRQSYITGMTADLVRQYRKHLTAEQVAQIAREVDEELAACERRGTTCGHDMDHREWARLVADLRGGPK